MNPSDHAASLRNAYGGVSIDPIGAHLADADAAYEVQEINTEFWLQQGRRLSGRKIGLTARKVQEQLGVDQPDYGMLFEDMRLELGEPVQLSGLIQPKAEAEIAFVINGSIDDPHVPYVELMRRIEYLLPAVEIVDSRIRDWKISLNDTIADNASSAKYVLGARPVSLANVSLATVAMSLNVGGVAVSEGIGAACLGHPLNAVLWLAKTMAARGRPLSENDVVLSGALGPMVAMSHGDQFECRIDGFESIRLQVE